MTAPPPREPQDPAPGPGHTSPDRAGAGGPPPPGYGQPGYGPPGYPQPPPGYPPPPAGHGQPPGGQPPTGHGEIPAVRQAPSATGTDRPAPFVSTPNAERYLLEADNLRRRQLRSALLHGSGRTWRDRRRLWPAALGGVIVVALVCAAIAVYGAFQMQQRERAEQERQRQEQQQELERGGGPGPSPTAEPLGMTWPGGWWP